MRDCSLEARYDEDGVQATSGLDARGHELPDPVPTAPPVGYQQGPTLQQMIQRMIQQESRSAAEQGFETFEEAEDFDIAEDPLDQLTPYEEFFDPPALPAAPVPTSSSVSSPQAPEPSGAGARADPTPGQGSDQAPATASPRAP